tara:strand:+ start:664 stop:1254 length:591 start_codon:yes stop_codon:yes gene_type:complete
MKISLVFITTHCILLSLDLRKISDLNDWKKLQEKPVKIEWQEYQGFPISKAEMVLDYDINLIAGVIQDLNNYPKIFKRVTKTHHIESNIVQIVLDMPFPFSGRDYIIKYTTEKGKNKWIFSFYSVDFPTIKPEGDHVRLPNAAGVWILNTTENNSTKVTYAWNGELLGNFPDFGLERAWVTQGTEVLNWLNESLSN